MKIPLKTMAVNLHVLAIESYSSNEKVATAMFQAALRLREQEARIKQLESAALALDLRLGCGCSAGPSLCQKCFAARNMYVNCLEAPEQEAKVEDVDPAPCYYCSRPVDDCTCCDADVKIL